jgi:GntR family transcriptional regulator
MQLARWPYSELAAHRSEGTKLYAVLKSLYEITSEQIHSLTLYIARIQINSLPDGIMLRIDLASSAPVYEQIANGLRAELVSGQFSPGEKLPTVRALAIDLGVHHNTVAEAYRQLADEGWLELIRHHGAIVRERDQPEAGPDAMERFTRPLRELIAKGLADGLSPSSLAEELTEIVRRLKGGAI